MSSRPVNKRFILIKLLQISLLLKRNEEHELDPWGLFPRPVEIRATLMFVPGYFY